MQLIFTSLHFVWILVKEIVIVHNDIIYNNNIHINQHKNVKKKIKMIPLHYNETRMGNRDSCVITSSVI